MARPGTARPARGEGIGEAAVRVRDLTFAYPRAAGRALTDVTFAVTPGEILALLGPNGAGKSTTQMILTGRLRDWGGTAEVLGRDLRSWRARDYACVGVSFEQPALYTKMTGRENLRMFAALYPRPTRDVDELLAAVGLDDAADRRVRDYSKGMRVRLDLARALLPRAAVLFLDEPTSGLDPVSAATVRAIIRAEAESGVAVVLTTHDMVAADELADRVALMVRGRLAAYASPRELKLARGGRRVRVEHHVDDRLEVSDFTLDGLATDPSFATVLRSGRIETMHTTEPTLADVFVQMTGERLQ